MNQIFRPIPSEALQSEGRELPTKPISCTEYDDGNPATVALRVPAAVSSRSRVATAGTTRIGDIGCGPVEYDDGNPATISD